MTICRCPWQFEAFLIAEVAAVSGHHGDSAAAFLSRLAVVLGPDNEPLLAEACRVVLEPLFALTSPEAVPQLFKRLEVRGLVHCCVWGAAMCAHIHLRRASSQDAIVPLADADEEDTAASGALNDVGQTTLLSRGSITGLHVRRVLAGFATALFPGVSRCFKRLTRYRDAFMAVTQLGGGWAAHDDWYHTLIAAGTKDRAQPDGATRSHLPRRLAEEYLTYHTGAPRPLGVFTHASPESSAVRRALDRRVFAWCRVLYLSTFAPLSAGVA